MVAPSYGRFLTKPTTSYQTALESRKRVHFSFPFCVFSVTAWFDIVYDSDIDMLLGTLFIDQFIRRCFSIKRNVIVLFSHTLAILFTHQRQKPTPSKEAPLINDRKLTSLIEELPTPIQTAQQIGLKLQTQHHVLVTTSASGIYTIKPRIMVESMKMVSATYSVMNTIPS